jgi:type IV pilus assembly protein PilQ
MKSKIQVLLRSQAGEATEDEMSEVVPRALRAANHKPAIFALFLSIALILSNSVIAQEPIVEDISQPTETEAVSASGNVTLVFKDADIRTVLHTLSYKSGVNIVASSDVEGTVSIRLVDVPWETALEVILKNHGLAAEKVGNIIRVITLANVAEEELQNEVFVLNYAKAQEVATAIEATITERGRIKYDERTNTLIVTDIPTNLYKVRSVVSRLDKRTPQVSIEARLIETTLAKDENLGIDWTLEVTASGSKRPTTFPFENERTPFAKKKSGGSIQDYLPIGGDIGTGADDFSTPFGFPNVGGVATEAFAFGTLDFTQLSAVLEILNARTDTKIISKPTVTTLNNKEAKVHVGEDYYIPQYTINDQTGKWEVTGYSQRSIGVVLEVIPHINDTGDIVVDLKPEVSSFKGNQSMGGDIVLPIFSIRNAQAQIMVKNNQTIVMGGLMKETTTKYENKVPILGDIPLLGKLFTKTEDGVSTTDLLIFLTVRVIGDDEDDKLLMEETEAKKLKDAKAEKVSTKQ